MISVFGKLNTNSNNWCKVDSTSHEGSKIDAVTSNYGLRQLMREPTHIFNSSSSCIDQIFTSQTNLVMKLEVHSSLHPNCHHSLVCLFCIHYLTKELFGFMKEQTLNLSEELLMILIG